MTDALTPSFAIVIPAYNAGKYIMETLESVMSGSMSVNLEIIIVDDGSNDETAAICSLIASQRNNIKLVRQRNAGVSAARNAGLKLVKAEFVCFLDADDCLRADALNSLHHSLVAHPKSVGAFGAVQYIDENSNPANQNTLKVGPFTNLIDIDFILQSNFIDTPGAILFRTAKVVEAGGFDESIHIGEDWEMYIRIARLGNLIYCNMIVINYRLHRNSAMQTNASRLLDYEPVISKVFDVPVGYYNIPMKKLHLYRKRKTANIMRLIIIRSRGLIQFHNILLMLKMAIIAGFDGPIWALTAKSLLSAARRLH